MRHEPIPARLFVKNREALGPKMLPASLAILNANDIPPTNADGSTIPVPNSDLFYLSGIEQEESILVLAPDAHDPKPRDPDKPAVKKDFMHGIGHPMGLDVHDVGLATQPFAPGWVLTVVPGIYIPEEGFAVRLENDVLVTGKEPVDLMADLPIEAEEIEELMNKPRSRRTATARRKTEH